MPNKSPDYDRPAPGISPSRHGANGGQEHTRPGSAWRAWTAQTEQVAADWAGVPSFSPNSIPCIVIRNGFDAPDYNF